MAIDIGHLTVRVGPRDHYLGPPTAPVTLVEYGDYECPHCAAAYPIVAEIKQRRGDTLCLAYRHFPVARAHRHAERAAEAAEAAGSQGQFWAMHEALFQHQDALGDRSLAAYAESLGLDGELFAAELGSGAHLPRIRDEFASGLSSGVSGAPTFFINGWRYDGPWDLRSLLGAIDQAASS
jgi:protein-disulfide isomerase